MLILENLKPLKWKSLYTKKELSTIFKGRVSLMSRCPLPLHDNFRFYISNWKELTPRTANPIIDGHFYLSSDIMNKKGDKIKFNSIADAKKGAQKQLYKILKALYFMPNPRRVVLFEKRKRPK